MASLTTRANLASYVSVGRGVIARAFLEGLTTEQVRAIARVKGVRRGRSKPDTINNLMSDFRALQSIEVEWTFTEVTFTG